METSHELLRLLAEFYISICLLSCAHILVDQCRRPLPKMKIMLWVWPITALWAGIFGIWAYRTMGRQEHHALTVAAAHNERKHIPHNSIINETFDREDPSQQSMPTMMGMPSSSPHSIHWETITKGTLHCGSGCTLADSIGPWLFRLAPFFLFGSIVYGEWLVEYVLALIFGVFFQYAALASMITERGLRLWWKAFTIDFLSLTAWQLGMYGWMAIVVFLLLGPLSPKDPIFWFMMQIGMFCGFLTSYPMNWLLIRNGIKSVM